MLVLRRRKNESVVIGDQITLTVQDFSDEEVGRGVFGATVRLGFEMPRYIEVCRDELYARRQHELRSGGPAPPRRARPGDLVELPGVLVRLRLSVPRKVPVCHNDAMITGRDLDLRGEGPRTVYFVTCRDDDRITICKNIRVATLGCHRFVARESMACLSGQ